MTQEQIEAIAFAMWIPSLHVEGFPKNIDGSSMTFWQLYDYWLTVEERKIYLQHARDKDPNK